jgi:putative heme-binding domain-containing protein
MYGTLHVVSNLSEVPLDALAAPSDPGAESRPFVQAWTFEELSTAIGQTEQRGSLERGKALFQALACIRCHRMDAQERSAGPDLASVAGKIKAGQMTRADLLRELVEPSARIDPKYAMTTLVDATGRLHTGIVVERTGTEIRLMANPLDGEAISTISTADVAEEIPSQVSMMPAGQLNTLTREEIDDLLLYVESAGNASR